MSRKTPIVSRREVVAGIGGLAVYAAARPVMAQGPSGTPIKIGQTLSLTGPFAQTGLIHKIVSEYYVERINKNGGLLGRPVQYVLYDDQSKPDISRTLYEKLLTADKVDLILGPYSTAPILAAMGVAQRYNKVFIQSTMGVPALATYKWHFSALVSGPEPHVSLPSKILDCYASTGNAPKTIAVVTSKFPSAEDMAKGMRAQAEKRGLKEVAFLEYQTGNLDYGPIASRIKEADPDLMFVGCLGIEGNQLLEALSKVGYTPKRHFYLYPAPVLAGYGPAERATSLTNFEDVAPFITPPERRSSPRLSMPRPWRRSCPIRMSTARLATNMSGGKSWSRRSMQQRASRMPSSPLGSRMPRSTRSPASAISRASTTQAAVISRRSARCRTAAGFRSIRRKWRHRARNCWRLD